MEHNLDLDKLRKDVMTAIVTIRKRFRVEDIVNSMLAQNLFNDTKLVTIIEETKRILEDLRFKGLIQKSGEFYIG